MRLIPRLLGDEDELEREPGPEPEAEAAGNPAPSARAVGLVAVLALIPRLVYLFGFTDPENAGVGFTDTYHHWQIAYLTKEIGLSHGPRLWDMRGFEYWWGLLHPAVMNVVFFATGSTDVVLARLVSAVFGAASVALIFMICHRYWGLNVAIASAAFASLLPAAVFNDSAGLAEPLSVALVLLGIWLAPARGFWAGLCWGLAAMARTEAWLFTAGLVIAWLIGARRRPSRWWLVTAWAGTMVLYCKFLLDQTGNPIYPLYWTYYYVFSSQGGPLPPQTALEHAARPLLVAAVALGAAGVAWTLWKRPPSYLLLVYGFGYAAYSFATYPFVDSWKERRFEFAFDFGAILVAVLLFEVLPRHAPRIRPLSWTAAAAALAALQVSWVPIQSAYAATEPAWRTDVALGSAIGAVYNQPQFRGGVVAMPGDKPDLLYAMARYGNVPGDHLTSEFYDPFYYLPAGTHYSDDPQVVGPLISCWLVSTRTRLLLVPPATEFSHSVPDYLAFMADHPDWFADTHAGLSGGLTLYAVNIPPGSATCRR